MDGEEDFAALYKKLIEVSGEPDPRRAETVLAALLRRLFARDPPEAEK